MIFSFSLMTATTGIDIAFHFAGVDIVMLQARTFIALINMTCGMVRLTHCEHLLPSSSHKFFVSMLQGSSIKALAALLFLFLVAWQRLHRASGTFPFSQQSVTVRLQGRTT